MDNHRIELAASAQHEAPVDVTDSIHNVGASQGLKPVMAVRDNWELEDVEKFLERPTRIRYGQSLRTFDSFVDYVLEFKTAGTRIFIKGDEALCNIDGDMPDQPSWKSHNIALSLRDTDVAKFWLSSAANEIKSHKDLARALEKWRIYVHKPEGADLISILDSFYVINETKVFENVEIDRNTFRAGIEKTFRGATTKSDVEFPREFVLRFPIWVGLPTALDFRVRVDYRVTESTLAVTLHTADVQDIKLTAFGDLKKKLKEALKEIPVYL